METRGNGTPFESVDGRVVVVQMKQTGDGLYGLYSIIVYHTLLGSGSLEIT